jgi:tetratricopeptide (TPR) repeat protein
MQSSWLRLLDPEISTLKAEVASAPQTRLQLARALNGRCRHGEAAEILDQLLAEHRSDGEAWFERIVAEGDHAASEELENLHRELEAIRDESPADGTPRRNLGYVRILQQRPDDAERALRQALERNGQDPKTLELMGLLCLQRDQPSEAKGWFLKALSLQPRDPRTLRLLGITCDQLNDSKGAEAQFVAALDVAPNYFWGWHSLGELLLKRNIPEAGLRCIHRARSLQAREPASYFILAELFSEQGHLEMAQAELHQLLLLAPPAEVLAEAYAMLGELRRDLGDRDGAVSYFSLATETDPEAANPWSALGDLAREDKRWEDALRCYREALARDTDAADVQVQLGYVFLKIGQPAESERCFLAALESDPGEYSAYLGLSECYRQLQRSEDQLRMVQEAMTLAPDDPDVWNAQGVALEVTDRMAEATAAYEKALVLSPLHRKAANNLGFILERRMCAGEADLRERALEAWKRRLLICRDEGQSLKMAAEHLTKLGVTEETIHRWLEQECSPSSVPE